MMTGIQNVNSLEAGYYAATLIFIGWFALYDSAATWSGIRHWLSFSSGVFCPCR